MVVNGAEPPTGSKVWLYRHYGTSPDCVRRDVQSLKEWLSKQPHIPQPPANFDIDKWLENMLLMVKNSIAKTKTAIDLNIAGRTLGLQIFGNRDPLNNEMKLSFQNMILTFLPGVKQDGSKVVVFKPLGTDKDSLDLESVIKRCVMILDLCLRDGMNFSSLHIIIDVENVRFSHLAAFNAPVIRALTYCMKAYPVRVARINVVNVSTNIERMVAFFRPFISTKIMSRVYLTTNYKLCDALMKQYYNEKGFITVNEKTNSSVIIHKQPDLLYQVLDNKMLPKDYGGDGPCLTELSKTQAEKIKAEKEYFKICDSWKTDEKKRLSKNQPTSTEISDIGSFRKLSVD